MLETNNAKAELARYQTLRKRIPPHYLAYVAGEASYDAEAVEKTTNDYNWGIEQIQARKSVNRTQLEKIGGIQSTALEALRIEDDILQSISVAGLFAEFLTMQLRNVERAAQQAIPVIKALEEALRKAKRTSIGARFQQIADIGLTLLTVFVPELGILAKVSVAAAQFGMDKLLGGSKSTPTKDNASDYFSAAGVDIAAMEEWKWLSTTSRGALKTAGKGVAVVGLYFDQDEVQTALKSEAAVSHALAKAVENLRIVKQLADRLRPGMMKLRSQLIALGKEVQISKAAAADLRSEYRQQMREANYSTVSSVQWRYN
jgi:hypothetical protein